MKVRESLLESIRQVKGESIAIRVAAGDDLVDLVDSLDLLEILVLFDHRMGVVTDPQELPDSLDDFETVVARLTDLHGAR